MKTKQCTKCKKILTHSEFQKDKNHSDGLVSQCKKCRAKSQRDYDIHLKQETMLAFGGQCVYIDESGVRCSKNVKDDLSELHLSHPNGDGNEHRDLISNGRAGRSFYKALKGRNYDTDGFVVEIRCRIHHLRLDTGGKKNPNYGKRKQGKFNDPDWLKEKYRTMTMKEIAIECGVSEATIRDRIIRFNMPKRKSHGRYGKLNSGYKKGKFNNPAWLKKEYENMSTYQIADLCGVSVSTIRRRMIEFGHPRRKTS